MTGVRQLRKDIETVKRAIQPSQPSNIHLLLEAYELLIKGKVNKAKELWDLHRKK